MENKIYSGFYYIGDDKNHAQLVKPSLWSLIQNKGNNSKIKCFEFDKSVRILENPSLKELLYYDPNVERKKKIKDKICLAKQEKIYQDFFENFLKQYSGKSLYKLTDTILENFN